MDSGAMVTRMLLVVYQVGKILTLTSVKMKKTILQCAWSLPSANKSVKIVIPEKIRSHVMDLLHLGHCGMRRMKQLARSVVYWPRIDADIEEMCRKCTSCAEHQNNPPKFANHPWMLPERPWSRIHVDHAVNFMGKNWLVMVDSYSKYPCIHPTSSITARTTMDLLEEDFAHFGYPHTLVTDNAPTFTSEEFQEFLRERSILHMRGAPYHPAQMDKRRG